jgi:galactokinase
MPEPPGGFPLRARIRHQLSEARRVELARDALLAGDAELFGGLMNDSHESCARDYEISCPELNVLVKVALDAGALGARLTGAGFGGATVSLVPESRVDSFCEAIRRDYYLAAGLPASAARMLVASSAPGASHL